MLSVARDPSFKFACQRTNKKKNKKERGRRERGEERARERREEVSIDLRANPPREKVNEKKKGGEKKKNRKAEARPNPMKMFRVIVNSSTRQSTPWSADDEGTRGAPWKWPRGVWEGRKGDWRHCAWVVHYDSVDSPIRCVAFTTESSCQSVWKVRPVANCDLSPRKNSLISVDSARKREKAWHGIGCKRIRHLCDSYRDKSVSWTRWRDAKVLEFIQFHAQRNINRIDSFEKEILRGTMIAKFENVCLLSEQLFLYT